MSVATKLFLIDAAIKTLVTLGVGVWIFIVASLAISGLPMLRQLLGCMLSTMAIFGLLSLSVKSLKNYRSLLKNELV